MEKKEWHVLKNEYAWRESDMYSEGAKIVPVIVFMNEDTGETRGFATKIVEEKGTQFYLDMLNSSV